MNRYLRQNNISRHLSLRVVRNAQAALRMRRKQVPESAVGIEDLVSLPLRTELHFEMYFPYLSSHPFFDAFVSENAHVIRKVCHAAMTTSYNSMEDVIFHLGETCNHMTFIGHGVCSYTWGEHAREESLSQGFWLAEPVLWTHWAHRGDLIAKEDSRCLNLDAVQFSQTVLSFELNNFNPFQYAKNFLDKLNSTPPARVTDLPIEAPQRSSTTEKTFSLMGVIPDGRWIRRLSAIPSEPGSSIAVSDFAHDDN
jgi:hypothetical protein